jgi:hypothetical protein
MYIINFEIIHNSEVKQETVNVFVNTDQMLEKVKEFKLLGTWFSDNLKWGCHIKHLTSSCYTVLSTLRKLRNLTPPHVKKQLAESLILSKIYYNIIIYHPLPMNQLKKLQRVQNAAASFVTNKYCRTGDVLSLGWLPVQERIELELMRFAHRSISYLASISEVRTTY